MKTVITNAEFQRVLDILDLPGDTLSFEVGPRIESMLGVRSSWRLKAVIAGKNDGFGCGAGPDFPYCLYTVLVPVMLPGDEDYENR